jgi:hypothetical protein
MVLRRFSYATRSALVAVLVILLFGSAVIGDFFIARYAAAQEARQLCEVINLTTAHPIAKPTDPSQNPSRVVNYNYYIAFLKVKHQYGC